MLASSISLYLENKKALAANLFPYRMAVVCANASTE